MRNIVLALAFLLPLETQPDKGVCEVGLLQRYGPNKMRWVVQRRVEYGHVPAGTDPYMAIAVIDCSRLGEQVWLALPGGVVTGPHTIADCSAAADRRRHEEKGLLAEVSYEYAVDHSIDMDGGRYRAPLDDILPGVMMWTVDPTSLMRKLNNGAHRSVPRYL